MTEPYRVELDVYSGPLDLLLQLVTREEVSVYDIPIARITDQYLARLQAMPELDVETAADFLVLAASLLALKARLLLPPSHAGSADEGEEEVDPRAELVRRLVVYRQYREASRWLGDRLTATNRRFDPGRRPSLPERAVFLESGCLAAELAELVLAYEAALASLAAPEPEHRVAPVPFTVGEKIEALLARLERERSVAFDALFTGARTRGEVVATFLAVLELVRQGRVRARQQAPLGRLELVRSEPYTDGTEGVV